MERPVAVNPQNFTPYWLKNTPRPKAITLHEQQVEELKRQGTSQEVNYGPVAPRNIPALPSPVTSITTRGVFDSSIYFDSYFKETANYPDASIQYQTRVLNNNTDLNNIVQLRLSRFYFPRPTWEQPLAAVTADYLYLRKIYMFIVELPTSSTIGTNAGKSYHFELDVRNINSISTELVPVQQYINMPTPLQTISQLTFRFFLPPLMAPLILYKDTLVLRADTPVNFAFTQPGDYASVSTEYANGVAGVLTTQVAVWISATDPLAAGDSQRPEGWFVSAMLGLGAGFPFGGFTLATPPTPAIPVNTLVTFQVRKNRVAFEMRFTQMQTPTATGLIPIHK